MNIHIRPLLTHALAMAVAALLALALAGCGSDGTTVSYAPRSGAAVHAAQPQVTTSGEEASADMQQDAGAADVDANADASADAADVAIAPEPSNTRRAAAAPEVRRQAVALAIEEREPVDAAESYAVHEFEENGRIYAFYSLRNRSDEEAAATVSFVSPTGVSYGQIRLTVPANSPRYRTWAYTRGVRRGPEGIWEVRLSSDDGELLDVQTFELIDE